jgi:hypothetical protein
MIENQISKVRLSASTFRLLPGGLAILAALR